MITAANIYVQGGPKWQGTSEISLCPYIVLKTRQ